MKKKRILAVFGTRPEAVKMCPLVKELKKREGLETAVCVTGQHREMLDGVLETFGVVPDFDLDIMKERQTLFDITSGVIDGIRPVLEEVRPDILLVQGDTSTAFAAALAAFYSRIPVGHVEAGLRTFDTSAPWPEEFNRRSVDVMSSLCFAPTRRAARNLLAEGKERAAVFVTGNTVTDAIRQTLKKDYSHPVLEWAGDKRLIFITAHRREILGGPMRGIFRAIRRTLEERPDCRAVFPVHLNPAVREEAEAAFAGCGSIRLTGPLDVADCHNIEARSYLCLTDSGGVCEECPVFGVPVLVIRGRTDRPEGVEAGVTKVAGTREEGIYEDLRLLLDDSEAYRKMSRVCSPFGDGHASERIADVLERGECEEWRPEESERRTDETLRDNRQ